MRGWSYFWTRGQSDVGANPTSPIVDKDRQKVIFSTSFSSSLIIYIQYKVWIIIYIQIQSINDDNWIFYVTVQHGSSLLPHLKSWENVRSQPTIAQCFNKCKFYGVLEVASEIIRKRQKSVHLMRHRCRFPNEFKYEQNPKVSPTWNCKIKLSLSY